MLSYYLLSLVDHASFGEQIMRCNFQHALQTELVLVCAFELQIFF